MHRGTALQKIGVHVNRTRFRNLTILLGSTMTVMAGATIAPALPGLKIAFQDVAHADFLVKLVLTMPALLIAIGAPFAGILLDRWGRKPVLVLALILYGLAGTSGFLLGSLFGILVGRALLGLAVAGVMSGFTTLIADYFSGPKLNQFMGYQAAFMASGGVIFLLAGGYLADVGWQYPFLIYLFAFVVLPGVLFAIDEPDVQVSSQQQSVSAAKVAFISKNVMLIYAIAFLGMVIFYMVPVQLPFYLTENGVSSSRVGLALAVQALAAAITSLQFQKIKAHLSFERIAGLVFLAMGLGYMILAASNSYAIVILGLIIFGIGLGLVVPNLNVWLISAIPPAMRGRAIGGLTTSLFLGQFLSPIITQPILGLGGMAGAFRIVGSASILLGVVFVGLPIIQRSIRSQS